MKLTVLIDDHSYIKNEVYQSQLHEQLRLTHECQYVEWRDIKNVKPLYDRVFIARRMRYVVRDVDAISAWLGARHAIVQDYDPWHFFDDTSSMKGGYSMVSEKLVNVSFAVPNKHWCSIIESKTNRRAHSFRIGMSSKMCKFTPFEQRQRYLEFRGSDYPVRRSNMEKLKRVIPVDWSTSKTSTFIDFFNYLDNLQIWAHDESTPIFVDGASMCRNWLWPKAMEILARGCFLIRDKHTEADNYGLTSLPTCFLYDDISEAIDHLRTIDEMPLSEKNDRSRSTVTKLSENDVYVEACELMKAWW